MSKPTSTAPAMTSAFTEIDFSQLGTRKHVLSIEELAFFGHLNIRGASDNSKFMHGVENTLGVALPTQANTFLNVGSNTVLWLGPNEWLVITPLAEAKQLEQGLRTALSGVFSSVNEVSGGNSVLEVAGDKARDLLLKGCPLDLHSSVFKTGQCAQSVLAKTSMTLWQTEDAPVFRLVVRRSFADYLGHWLLDAAREFQDLT